MSFHIQISGLNGQGLYSPNSINEMETLIGGKVVLLKEPKPQLGLGGIVNVLEQQNCLIYI